MNPGKCIATEGLTCEGLIVSSPWERTSRTRTGKEIESKLERTVSKETGKTCVPSLRCRIMWRKMERRAGKKDAACCKEAQTKVRKERGGDARRHRKSGQRRTVMVRDVSVQVKERSSMLQECGNRHHLALTRVDKDQVSRMCEDRQVGVDPSDASHVSLDGVDRTVYA